MKAEIDRKHIMAGLFISAALGLAFTCVLAAASGAHAIFFLSILVLAAFLAGAGHFYYRWYLPLADTLEVVIDMADGKYNGTAPDTALGEAVNQVSVNTQEAFLLVWNHTRDAMRLVSKAKDAMPVNEIPRAGEVLDNLEKIDDTMAGIRDVISSFGFYGVKLVESGGVDDSPE